MNYKTFLFHHFINTLENIENNEDGITFHALSINTEKNERLVIDNLITLDSVFNLKINKYMPKKITSTILIRMCNNMKQDISNKTCYKKVGDKRTSFVKWIVKTEGNICDKIED